MKTSKLFKTLWTILYGSDYEDVGKDLKYISIVRPFQKMMTIYVLILPIGIAICYFYRNTYLIISLITFSSLLSLINGLQVGKLYFNGYRTIMYKYGDIVVKMKNPSIFERGYGIFVTILSFVYPLFIPFMLYLFFLYRN